MDGGRTGLLTLQTSQNQSIEEAVMIRNTLAAAAVLISPALSASAFACRPDTGVYEVGVFYCDSGPFAGLGANAGVISIIGPDDTDTATRQSDSRHRRPTTKDRHQGL